MRWLLKGQRLIAEINGMVVKKEQIPATSKPVPVDSKFYLPLLDIMTRKDHNNPLRSCDLLSILGLYSYDAMTNDEAEFVDLPRVQDIYIVKLKLYDNNLNEKQQSEKIFHYRIDSPTIHGSISAEKNLTASSISVDDAARILKDQTIPKYACSKGRFSQDSVFAFYLALYGFHLSLFSSYTFSATISKSSPSFLDAFLLCFIDSSSSTISL